MFSRLSPWKRIGSSAKSRDQLHYFVLLLSLCFTPNVGFAQVTTATLTGTVADIDGAVIPHATVTVKNQAT